MDTVYRIITLFDTNTKVAISIHIGMKDEVAVFIITSIVGIFRVLIEKIVGHQIRLRYDLHQLSKLLKKWTTKIEIPPIVSKIPHIRPSILLYIHWHFFIRRDVSNHRFTSSITYTMIEVTHILPS
jgi:hypothetical protein